MCLSSGPSWPRKKSWRACARSLLRLSRIRFQGAFWDKNHELVEDQSLVAGLVQEYFSDEFHCDMLSCGERVRLSWRKAGCRATRMGPTPTPLLDSAFLDGIKSVHGHQATGGDDIPGTI